MQNEIKFIPYDSLYNEQIVDLWNKEIGFIFKLDCEMFSQKVNNKYLFLEGSNLAFHNDKLVGFIISKVFDNSPLIPKYHNYGWISLIYVSFNYRKQGIGNYLLTTAEAKLVEYGVETIQVGSDLECFFPGIPSDFDNLSDKFFSNHGYTVSRYTHDLLKKITLDDLQVNDKQQTIIVDGKEKTVNYYYATKQDQAITMKFFEKCFFGRWYDEANTYFLDNDIVNEYLLAVIDNEVVGFLRVNFGYIKKISYNNTWRNNFGGDLVGVGPLGVDPIYRGNGIAKSLIKKAMSDAAKFGFTNAMIDWTGLMHIYQKYGFQVWKCYAYTLKKIQREG